MDDDDAMSRAHERNINDLSHPGGNAKIMTTNVHTTRTLFCWRDRLTDSRLVSINDIMDQWHSS